MRFGLLTLCLAWCTALIQAQQITISRSFSSSAPCAGLFSSGGFSGCSSKKDNNKNVGELQYFASIGEVTDAIAAKNFSGSYVISSATWCFLTREILEQLKPFASSLLILESGEAYQPCLKPSRFNSLWNKYGSQAALAGLDFPVSRLSQSDSTELLDYMAGLGMQKVRFEFYMGQTDGSMDSAKCLSQGRCIPLGGVSSWGAVRTPPLAEGENAILLAANLDSTAFFHDLSFGFHASGGDIVVLLATLEVLARQPITPTRIVSAVFQGEAYGRIGSKRFVDDVLFGRCRTFSSPANKTCADPPNFSLEYTKFQQSLSPFKSVVSLSNVLRTDLSPNGTTVFVANNSNELTNLIATRFSDELDVLGVRRPANLAQPHELLPPSPLTSFVERPEWQGLSDKGGLVVAGYTNDVHEANSRFETEDDTMDLSRLDEYIERVDTIASALAKSIYFAASNGTVITDRADRSLVHELLMCFGGDFVGNCTLALNALNATRSQLRAGVTNSPLAAKSPFPLAATKPLASYTGVYRALSPISGGVKIREQFVRNLMANITLGGAIPSPRTQEPFQRCASDVTCRDSWPEIVDCPGVLASNASVACVGGRCVCSTTFYHDAWSVGLLFDENRALKLNATAIYDAVVWTEPTWAPDNLLAFTSTSSADAAASIIVGLLLIGGSFILVRIAKNKQERLGKFKLS